MISGSSHIIGKPFFSSSLGCRVGRCEKRKPLQHYRPFVHSFNIYFSSCFSSRNIVLSVFTDFSLERIIIQSRQWTYRGKKAKEEKIDFSKIKPDRLLFDIMLLSSRMRCFLVYAEKMLIVIDRLSSTSCHSHSVLKIIKTGYRAKTKIQEIVKNTNIHFMWLHCTQSNGRFPSMRGLEITSAQVGQTWRELTEKAWDSLTRMGHCSPPRWEAKTVTEKTMADIKYIILQDAVPTWWSWGSHLYR